MFARRMMSSRRCSTKPGQKGRGGGASPSRRIRHAELVSASMAYSLGQRCTPFEGRPWTLKQVQGDDEGEVGCGGRSLLQHLTPTPLGLGAPTLKRRGFPVAQSCSSMWSALDTLHSPGPPTLACPTTPP